jgi:hypothetical protein
MIQAVTDYVVNPFRKILLPDGVTPLPVYPPDSQREHGETALPCVALSLDIEPKEELDRPHCSYFIPSEEQQTIQIKEELGHLFKAEIVSSEAEPFVIDGDNGALKLRVGTPGAWGPDQTVTILPGSRDAWEIARAVNYWARGIVATYRHGRVRIEADQAGHDLEILTGSTASEILGLPVGFVSHLTRTGPVSYTVKPYPIPFILTFQCDLRAADKAQRDALLPMVMNLFPESHWPVIKGQKPHFRRSDYKNFDELAAPEWWSAFWCEVDCIWLERRQSYQVKSIITPELEFAG